MDCPCRSGAAYSQCCGAFHQGFRLPESAGQLMRSRYTAYAQHRTDYIVATTVPAQQPLLDTAAIAAWSRQVQWLGLTVRQHIAPIGARHAQVAFSARFSQQGTEQLHEELSAFVQIGGAWFFIDPTVPLPPMKSPCFCGSGKKFKTCCGQFFR